MLRLIKKVIPVSGRQAIRRKLDDWELRRAMEPLRRNGKFSTDELAAFHKAWGNEGFSADRRYLAEVIRLIEAHPGPVLECGTGGTTVLAGVLAERYDFDVYSLEQDPEWSVASRRAVRYNDLKRVRIFDTPLKKFSDYMWYDTERVSLPKHFGLIICDGPFIEQTLGDPIYPNWRYGVLPYLKQSGTTFDALLLDDVNDQRAKGVLDRWQREYDAKQELISAQEGDCAIIRAGR
jgi:hypothetical protein